MDEEARSRGLKRTAKFLFSALTSVCLASTALVAATAVQYRHDFNRNIPVQVGSGLRIPVNEFALSSPIGYALRPVRVSAVKINTPVIIAQAEVEQEFILTQDVLEDLPLGEADARSVHAFLSRRFAEITLLSESAIPLEGDMDSSGILEVLSLDEKPAAVNSRGATGPIARHTTNQAMDIHHFDPGSAEYSKYLRTEIGSHYKDPIARIELPRIFPATVGHGENIQTSHIHTPKKIPAQFVTTRDARAVKELVRHEESPKDSQILNNQTMVSGVSKDVVSKDVISDHAEKLVTLQTAYLAMNIQTTQRSARAVTSLKDYVMDQGDGYPQKALRQNSTTPQNNNNDTATHLWQTTVNDMGDSEAPTGGFRGKVLDGFSAGQRLVEGAEIRILGTEFIAESDAAGEFEFKNVRVSGALPVLVSKKGYLARRVDLKEGVQASFELVSENAVAISAIAAGERRAEGTGFVFGQLTSSGESFMAGKRIDVTGPADVTRVYLNEQGIPDKELAATSSRGQFMLLNVRPGTYLISIVDERGRERAPHVVCVGEEEGILRGFDMGAKMTIRGRVFNAIASAPVEQAQVQLLGSSLKSNADRSGRFTVGPLYVDCGENNYLQIDRSGYYRNRLDFSCANTSPDLYVFPAGYIDQLGGEAGVVLKADKGVIVGNESFKGSVKMQLWGPEERKALGSLRGQDFYFDGDGVLNSMRNRTARGGNFTILDAPEGLSYIQAFDKDGKTLSYWPIFLSPSTVNVYRQ